MKDQKFEKTELAIMGGSGFYEMESLKNENYIRIDTPYGSPSEKILTGELNGNRIAFLSRHGIGHRFNPSEVNYRANLYALKLLGVKRLISFTAVGSLKEKIEPTDIVIPDQYYDNTFKREKTYFEDGFVAHVSMAKPVCPFFSDKVYRAAKDLGLNVHKGGTYFNMEGPQFSSIGESNVYRDLDFSIIGMTQAIEAKLARELEMCFIPVAFVTDYDCWHPETESVTAEMVVTNLNKNIKSGKILLEKILPEILSAKPDCSCSSSLENSFMTDPGKVSEETKNRLMPIIKKYLNRGN
ncbi:MAG: S-methyl-5'-thioadenosine phosphorylase [Acidobacteriota bacterium]